MLAVVLSAPPPFSTHKAWGYEFPWPNTISAQGEVYAVGGRLFFVEPGGFDGGPYGCLDAGTGKLLWRRAALEDRTETMVVAGGHVVVRVGEEIRDVSPTDGRTLWTTKAERYRLGPFVEGDLLVAETAKGRLEGFDLRTHAPRWRLDYPAEFASDSRNAMACVTEGALWAGAGDGRIVKVGLADGKLAFARPFDGGEAGRMVPMQGAVAICGTEGTAAWRAENGSTLWRRSDLIAANGFYAATAQELWQVTNDGESLTRIRARTGLPAGPATPLGTGHGYATLPSPYGDGYVLPGYESIVRLDAEGRVTGEVPTLYTPYGLLGVGRDLVAWQGGTIYRLMPGVAVPPPDAAATAQAIAAKSELDDRDIRALWDLGRAAVPALVAALPGAADPRRGSLDFALTHIATPEDTPAMLDLAERIGVFSPKNETRRSDVSDWLRWKGDPDIVARRLLSRLQATDEDDEARRLIPYINRSTDAEVVEELFRRLRSPASSPETKALIYGSIAASGRPDVLDWILRQRAQGRRLTAPIPGLSTTKDTDGDGIPDAYDANPYVAPRALNETERVMAAAFDAFARADNRQEGPMDVGYGPGIRPFELTGWKGGLRPLTKDFDRGPKDYPYGFIFETFSSDGNVVRFEPNGLAATVRIARRYGYGTEARLRKIRGEWFVVSFRETWIN